MSEPEDTSPAPGQADVQAAPAEHALLCPREPAPPSASPPTLAEQVAAFIRQSAAAGPLFERTRAGPGPHRHEYHFPAPLRPRQEV
jgi:hypothetical protein